jgi:hypothetical protein
MKPSGDCLCCSEGKSEEEHCEQELNLFHTKHEDGLPRRFCEWCKDFTPFDPKFPLQTCCHCNNYGINPETEEEWFREGYFD